MAFEPLTYEDLVRLWRGIFPRSYTVPIEEEFNGQGFDVFSQQARQFARAAEAIAVTQQTYYKLPHSSQIRPQAAGGRAASGEVLISRVPSALGEVVIDAGTVLEAVVEGSRGEDVPIGRFRTLTQATLSPGSPGPITVEVECTREGYQGNVAAESINSFASLGRSDVVLAAILAGNILIDNGVPDRFSEAMIGRYLIFIDGVNVNTVPRRIIAASGVGEVFVDGPPLDPTGDHIVRVLEFSDLGLLVTQPEALTGGRHAWLDAIGAERGVYRQQGETDEQFAQRVCFLADSITPAAVERLCSRTLGACGVCCDVQEIGSQTNGFFWDLPINLAPEIRSPWDDPDSPQNGVVWNSAGTQNGYLIIYVSCSNAGDNGFAYDASPYAPTNDNAWDWPEDAPPQLSPPVWNGYPVDYAVCIGVFADALRNILAAGVQFQIVQDCALDCGCTPIP